MRGVAMDPTTRARARLWLRSEKALGQEALPLRKSPRAVAEKIEKMGKPATAAAPAAKGEKSAPAPSNPAPKPVSNSSITLQQAPAAPSIDLFVADGPASLPALSREEKTRLLAEMEEQQVRNCAKCRLSETRTQTDFG